MITENVGDEKSLFKLIFFIKLMRESNEALIPLEEKTRASVAYLCMASQVDKSIEGTK
jgi:hypothetical protein